MQPRISPIRHEGQFLGLNTTLTPRQLPPAFGTVCHNVLVSEGRIRPRLPWYRLVTDGIPGQQVVGMLNVRRGGVAWLLVKTAIPGTPGSGMLWNVTDGQVTNLAANLSPWPVCWVFVGDTVYVIDGTTLMVKTRGGPADTVTIGIPAPVAGSEHASGGVYGLVIFGWDHPDYPEYGLVAGGSYGLGFSGTYSYAVTYRNRETGVESNPVYSGPVTLAEQFPRIFFNFEYTPNNNAGIDEVRIYRRNDTLGQPFYRLVDQGNYDPIDPFSTTGDEFVDQTRDADITVSDTSIGPFAPSRNGLPPKSRCAAWYEDRMFYAAVDEPGKLYYSGKGYPEHVAGDAFVNVTGDESDDINGLLASSGQLFIGKAKSIHILSGPIIAPDNLTRALGTPDSSLPASTHQLFRAGTVDVGPQRASAGNGLVSAGGRVLFANDGGLYAFDGQQAVNVSTERIGPTWRAFMRRGTGRPQDATLTFAHDPEDGVLYICNGTVGDILAPPVLAFHYRLAGGAGGWTTLSDAADPFSPSLVTAVAGSLGDTAPREITSDPDRETALFIGQDNGRVFLASDRESLEGFAPPFMWETGDLAVTPSLRKHFYSGKWHLHRTTEFHGDSPVVELGYRLDAGDVVIKKTTGLVGSRPIRQFAIGRTGDDIRLVIRKALAWQYGWSPDVGFTGFELAVELSGQR